MHPKERKALGFSLLAAALAALLLQRILASQPVAGGPAWVADLPGFNACANAASALCALAGFLAIRSGRRALHRGLMLGALACSALFLAGYLLFHFYYPETRFGGEGWLRRFYLGLLASHVLASLLVLPWLLSVVAFAGLGFFERHKRWARWALPLWLYVSLSGVAVYFLLKPYYPQGL